VAAPVIALAKSDRFLFILNIVSFCLLPGLVFSSLRRMGVAARVAYSWMWLLPTGYCFLLQAGSLGNDLFSATLALAAIDYGLRARQQGRLGQLWLSMLALALATGVKANTLPLILVWAVVVAPCWPLLRSKTLGTLTVSAVALLVSFVPTAVLNWAHCGDWTGAAAEHFHFNGANPLARISGNMGIVLVQNLSPPIAPFARIWNEHVATRLVPTKLQAAWNNSFMSGSPLLDMDEMQTEEGAGLGLGISVLLAMGTAAAIWYRSQQRDHKPSQMLTLTQALIFVATALACVACLEASFVRSTARLLAPYYPLLIIPFLIHRGQTLVVRTQWWRAGALAVALMVAFVLVFNPARPLLPMHQVLTVLREKNLMPSLVARAERVYSVYGQRAEAFAPALKVLPPEVKVLGLVTFDDPEAALWRPFGSRRIIHVCPGDDAARLRAAGVRYVLVGPQKFAQLFSVPFKDWLAGLNATVVQSIALDLRADHAEAPWQLVELGTRTGGKSGIVVSSLITHE
jgi:hypothetical protein